MKNHHNPDLAEYPLYAKTTPIKFVLQPGETLFIPSGWWHTARSLTPSISVAFDQLCASNWGFFKRDCLRMRKASGVKRLIAAGALNMAGALLGIKERVAGKR